MNSLTRPIALSDLSNIDQQYNSVSDDTVSDRFEPSEKRTLQMYINEEVETLETLGTQNPCQLKPTMKCSNCTNEEWEEIEAIIANPDVSKHHCIQSTWSYDFFIYNSPKHGLVEIIYSNWIGHFSSVTQISRNYLASNIRPQEVKMTFERYLMEIRSGYVDTFITNPSLEINDSIRALVDSKKDEITLFYESDYKCTIDQMPEEYMKNLYITLGSIDDVDSLLHSSDRKGAKSDVTFFVTKTIIYMKNYNHYENILVLFAQLDENNFVSSKLVL